MSLAPFDVSRLHGLLRTAAFGRNLIFEPSVGSTMDLARDAAHHGAAEGTVALADEQTAGRGRLGRSWLTPAGANLAFTIVLRPPAYALRQLAMIAPLAAAHAAEEAGVGVTLKWPNDVQAGGKKIAGILIESELDEAGVCAAFVGIGLNVNFDPRSNEAIRDIATSMAVELGRPVDREPLLASLLLEFERLYAQARDGGSVRDAWRARLATLGQHVTATMPSRTVEGVAEDVGEDGSLIVRTVSGERVVVEAGDVTLRH